MRFLGELGAKELEIRTRVSGMLDGLFDSWSATFIVIAFTALHRRAGACYALLEEMNLEMGLRYERQRRNPLCHPEAIKTRRDLGAG